MDRRTDRAPRAAAHAGPVRAHDAGANVDAAIRKRQFDVERRAHRRRLDELDERAAVREVVEFAAADPAAGAQPDRSAEGRAQAAPRGARGRVVR